MAIYPIDKNTSPKKSASRSWAYGSVPRCRFWTGYHIVMAGQSCGDIRHLLNHDVNPNHIIACDLDRAARDKAHEFGVVVSPYPDVADTTRWVIETRRRKNLASINIDPCDGIQKSTAMLDRVLECGLSPLTKVFLTFARRGRDGMNDAARIQYLEGMIHEIPTENRFFYSSWTKVSKGLAMACFIIQ